uniref:Uncharacterized protein n=1 Tax=Anguilla anguilla TaxID=7936 RepID=A0A0E9U8G1_ANGAN
MTFFLTSTLFTINLNFNGPICFVTSRFVTITNHSPCFPNLPPRKGLDMILQSPTYCKGLILISMKPSCHLTI